MPYYMRGATVIDMGIGFRFGLGPLRFYLPLTSRRRATTWTHPGCTIQHRTKDAANRCKQGELASTPARDALVAAKAAHEAALAELAAATQENEAAQAELAAAQAELAAAQREVLSSRDADSL